MPEFFIIISFLTLIIFLIAVILGGIFYTLDLFMEIPYVATNNKDEQIILDFAKIKKNAIVFDLGSGDARLLIAAAKKGALAYGYEINPVLVFIARLRIKLNHLELNAKVHQKTLWSANIKNANVVIVYAKKKSMKKFEDFIFKNCTKNTKIIVKTNPFPSKKPDKITGDIYMYIIKYGYNSRKSAARI